MTPPGRIEERLVFSPDLIPSDVESRVCKRTVAVLDLLGFRSMVDSMPTLDVAMKYEIG